MIKIFENFISTEDCVTLLKEAIDTFEIDRRTYSGWKCRINRSSNFEDKIKSIIKGVSPIDPFHINWINLTEYTIGNSLDLHKDERSKYTFTIPLTQEYRGGDFIIENNTYRLNRGDCIAFTGGELKHGVLKVTDGYRASLNIWIKEGKKTNNMNVQKFKKGVIAGNFDIIHPGYIKMFKEAAANCDCLIVLLHTDPSIERPHKLKPILSVEERKEMLFELKSICDLLTYTYEEQLLDLLKMGEFDVRFLGDDYKGKSFTGDNLNIPIYYLNRDHGWSTTKFKKMIGNTV